MTATPPASFAKRSCIFSRLLVRGRLLDRRFDLLVASVDLGLRAGPVDDRGVFHVDRHLLGTAEHGKRYGIELDAETPAGYGIHPQGPFQFFRNPEILSALDLKMRQVVLKCA